MLLSCVDVLTSPPCGVMVVHRGMTPLSSSVSLDFRWSLLGFPVFGRGGCCMVDDIFWVFVERVGRYLLKADRGHMKEYERIELKPVGVCHVGNRLRKVWEGENSRTVSEIKSL